MGKEENFSIDVFKSLATAPFNLNDPFDCCMETTFVNFPSSPDPLTIAFFLGLVGTGLSFSSLASDSPSVESDSSSLETDSSSLETDEEDSDDPSRMDEDALLNTADESFLARTDEAP